MKISMQEPSKLRTCHVSPGARTLENAPRWILICATRVFRLMATVLEPELHIFARRSVALELGMGIRRED